MSIFNRSKILMAEIQELRTNTETLAGELKKSREIQELLVKDILTLQEVTYKYVGNDYREYETAIQAINDKYVGKADWGVLQTRTVIDLRAAFILGEGLRVTHTTETREEAERELQFIEDFRAFNDLDGELDQEIAKEAEIEGKIAIRLYVDEEVYRDWPGMISARFLSWLSKKYKVIADAQDYLWYKKIEWPATATASAGSLEEPDFVYAKFGGRINMPNEAQPKIMACLTQIDRLDRALRDLREINHLFASPTPHFQVIANPDVHDENAQVQALTEYINKTNWKIGKALVTRTVFTLVGPDAQGIEILIKEIELCVKMISGTTGIPIHYLGLLDLLHNRATGDNTRELIMAATNRERQTWIAVYEELFTKAMLMWNETYVAQKSEAAKLDPTRIKVDIPQITEEHWTHIEKVLIPAASANIISREHVASQIPGVDTEAEAELREEREAKEAERAKEEMRALQDRMNQDEDQDQRKQGAVA